MAMSYRFSKSSSFTADLQQRIVQASNEALSAIPAGTTLLAHAGDDGTVTHYYVFPSEQAASANRPFRLAQALGARSEAAEAPDLSTSHLARLAWTRRSSVEVETQSGTSLEPVAEALEANLLPGDWVAISVREPGRLERSRWATWFGSLRSTSATHHSLRTSARAVSLWAGSASSARSAQLLQSLTAALGGFDVLAQAAPVRKSSTLAPFLVAAIVAGIAGVVLGQLPGWLAPVLESVPDALPVEVLAAMSVCVPFSFAVAGVTFTYWVVAFMGLVPSPWSQLQRRLRQGGLPAPRRRVLPPRAPRAARSVSKRDEQGNQYTQEIAAVDGSYPLAASVFMVGSELVSSVMLPGRRAAMSTADQPAPAVLREPIGPEVGVQDEAAVHVSLSDLWAGFMAFGEPGSGKSALLAAVVGQVLRLLSRDAPGKVALAAFDTKGDGKFARTLVRWGQWAGVQVQVLRLADETVPLAVDFFGKDGTPAQTRARMIDAIKYLEGQGVGARAEEVMLQVFPLAFLVDDVVASQVPAVESGRSPFYYAWVLTGGLGPTIATDLVEQIRVASTSPERDGALAGAGDLFGGGMSASARQTKTESSRNKFATLAQLEHLWSAAAKPDVPGWEVVLGGQRRGAGESKARMVVFDFGGLEQSAREDAAALIFFTLRAAIERLATGFQDRGRSIVLVADEVKAIARDNGDVINWLRSDGRSFGTVPMWATQEPKDLSESVLSKVMGYATRLTFAQQSSTISKLLAQEMSFGASQLVEDDVRGLAKYSAIVSTRVGGQLQAPFIVRVPDFEQEWLPGADVR